MMVGMLVKNFSEMKKDNRYRIIAVILFRLDQSITKAPDR